MKTNMDVSREGAKGAKGDGEALAVTPRTDREADHPYNIHLDNDRNERLGKPLVVQVVPAAFDRTLERELTAAQAEVEAWKATNERLNRRCQKAESALPEWRKFSELTKEQAIGRFFPALMRCALNIAEDENNSLRAQLAATEARLADALKVTTSASLEHLKGLPR